MKLPWPIFRIGKKKVSKELVMVWLLLNSSQNITNCNAVVALQLCNRPCPFGGMKGSDSSSVTFFLSPSFHLHFYLIGHINISKFSLFFVCAHAICSHVSIGKPRTSKKDQGSGHLNFCSLKNVLSHYTKWLKCEECVGYLQPAMI